MKEWYIALSVRLSEGTNTSWPIRMQGFIEFFFIFIIIIIIFKIKYGLRSDLCSSDLEDALL